MTGVDDPYEAPTDAELRLEPGDAAGAVEAVLALLRQRAVIV